MDGWDDDLGQSTRRDGIDFDRGIEEGSGKKIIESFCDTPCGAARSARCRGPTLPCCIGYSGPHAGGAATAMRGAAVEVERGLVTENNPC